MYKLYITHILIFINSTKSFYTLNPHIYIEHSTNIGCKHGLYTVDEYYMVNFYGIK